MVLEKKILCCQCIFAILPLQYLPLEGGVVLHLNKFESSSLNKVLSVPSLVETSRLVLKKKTLKCYQIVSAILLLKFYQDRPNMVSKEECTNFVQCMNTYNRDRSSMLLQCNLAYSKIVALANISRVICDVRFITDF